MEQRREGAKKPDSGSKRSYHPLVQVARYSHIGFMLPAAAMVGYGLGWLLDNWLGTTWMQVAGVILGMIAGFVEVIRLVMQDRG